MSDYRFRPPVDEPPVIEITPRDFVGVWIIGAAIVFVAGILAAVFLPA
jgi:hypothetical protein